MLIFVNFVVVNCKFDDLKPKPMRLITYLLFVLIFTGCFSTALLNQEMNVVKRYAEHYGDLLEPNSTLVTAQYNYTVEQLSPQLYIKKIYFPETKQLTHLKTFSDPQLRNLNGLYQHYYDNGNQTVEGYYTNGMRSGKWKYFNTYTIDGLSHYLKEYGTFVNDQRSGVWTGLDSLGNIISEHTYQNDELNGIFTIYNEDGSIKNKGLYKDGEMIESQIEAESPTLSDSIEIVEKMPLFISKACIGTPDSLQKTCSDRKMLEFIYKNIRYPSKAREEGVQGSTIVRFVVDKSGKVRDIECLSCLCQPIKDEVLRIVHSFPDWKPGEQRGEPVNVYFNLPINFRLE